MELLFGNLLAVTLHAAGLHHHRIPEFRGIALREVPQRVAHAQQDFRFFIPGPSPPAAPRSRRGRSRPTRSRRSGGRPCRPATNPCGAGSWAAGRKGSNVRGRRKRCGTPRGMPVRRVPATHRMARGRHAVVGRRGEDRLGRRFTAVDIVCLEQLDGQERNLFRRANLFRLHADSRQVLPVGDACGGLTAEYLQCRPGESRVVRDTEYVVGSAHCP